MARDEGFTYNGYTVGGSAPTSTTEVVGPRFGWDNDVSESDEVDSFVCEFIVKGTSKSDLETKCTAMRAALRAKNQGLTIFFGATTIATYVPAVATATGWDARPSIRKLRRRTTDVGFCRGYEFRVSCIIPSNYTDPNLTPGLEAGRRTSGVSLSWDTGTRRVVTIEGKFFQTAAQLPRAKTTTAALNNPTGPIDTYCVARLAKIDPSAQWTIGRRKESDNNTQTEMVFSRDYYETIGGRFTSIPEISFRGSRLRDVTLRGVYFRTYSAGYTGSATRSATENYKDPASGGKVTAAIMLAALPAELGGALTVDTDCEIVHESVVPNEQDDKLDYIIVYRELRAQQSSESSPGKDDPDITNDQIRFFIDYTPLDDSRLPGGSGNAQGPNPFKGVPSVGGGGKPANTGNATLDKSVVPPGGGNPGEQERSTGALPTKPIMLKIDYSAELRGSYANPKNKWYTAIRPFLMGQFAANIGFAPTYLIGDHFEFEQQTNQIKAFVLCVVLPGHVLAYKREDSIVDDIGEALDPALTGEGYTYLRQQEFAERTKIARHTVTFKTGSAFDPSTLLTNSSDSNGYVVIQRSVPSTHTKTIGIPDLGVATQELTTLQFIEVSKFVSRNVGPPTGNVPNGAAVVSQSVTPPSGQGGR